MSDATTRLAHPGWRQTRQDALTRELRLRDFDAALALVNRLAEAAEDHLRRPDMCITEFNHVQITVANLHHADLTQAEFRLLEKVNAVVEADPGAEAIVRPGLPPPDDGLSTGSWT
jgi:pterin-4a-carbinolamine dehydratase